ncbi:MAG: hypothetical protein GY772_22290 [bacterium]|nr:hypothetical protein [bacterium]
MAWRGWWGGGEWWSGRGTAWGGDGGATGSGDGGATGSGDWGATGSGGTAGAGGGAPSGGGGGRRRARGEGTRDETRVDPSEVVYSTWPASAAHYAGHGEDSWQHVVALAAELGCKIGVRDRRSRPKTVARSKRAAVLTVKGPNCKEVYEYCLKQAMRLGFDLSRVTPISVT